MGQKLPRYVIKRRREKRRKVKPQRQEAKRDIARKLSQLHRQEVS